MHRTEKAEWTRHVRRAHGAAELTRAELRKDLADIQMGIPPRNLLRLKEGMMAIYADSIVPYDWIPSC